MLDELDFFLNKKPTSSMVIVVYKSIYSQQVNHILDAKIIVQYNEML